MQLIRHQSLGRDVKKLCPVPKNCKEQGVFLALVNCHDLPTPRNGFVNADLGYLLKHGRVWVGVAGTDPRWSEIQSISDLPTFQATVIDNYDSCSVSVVCTPYMPQFFFAPLNMRGRRVLRRIK